ncbi:MAG TPA: hypothetical protein VMU06_17920 [Stellaceae bacterium]|nr:hypothetical protein [Stellaceae bacterium]
MSDGTGVNSAVAWPPAEPYQAPADDGKPHIWAQKGFQFHDLLDIVNPLQHLPIIGSVYRWITGDTIGNLPRIAGDALYGGLIGFASGLVNVLVKEETGRDIGETVVALVTGSDDKPAASAAPQAPASAPTQTPDLANIAPAAAPPPANPDHPAIPLVRGVGTSVPAAPTASAPANPAQAFLAQQAERRRQLYGAGTAPAAANGRVLSPQPVPLSIPPGSLPVQGRVTPVSFTATAPAPAQPAATPPTDISQKMIDALDKYALLQRQREGTSAPRGSQVDVAP